MVAKQKMMQTITQAVKEAAKTSIIADKEVENAVNAAKSAQIMPRTGDPALKQPTFN